MREVRAFIPLFWFKLIVSVFVPAPEKKNPASFVTLPPAPHLEQPVEMTRFSAVFFVFSVSFLVSAASASSADRLLLPQDVAGKMR